MRLWLGRRGSGWAQAVVDAELDETEHTKVARSGAAAYLRISKRRTVMVMQRGRKVGWRKRITASPDICHGKPCIKGTRIMVSIILDYLAAGDSVDEILEQYPTLSCDDVRVAQTYAAWLAHEEESHPLHTEAMTGP